MGTVPHDGTTDISADTSESLGTLKVNKIPAELLRDLRIKAAQRETTMRDLVIEGLRYVTGGGKSSSSNSNSSKKSAA